MSDIIEIKPLTRVEGHGMVRVYREGQRVERVELSLIEPPRLFEALLLGKHFSEVPDIICRICSLCSTIHRVTSLMAIEKALDIQVSEQTRRYRELIVLGGHIQSHALHLFCLVLPDYFNVKSFADLATVAPELLKLGLKIKAVGNDIQETIGGRLIHPVNVRIGGMAQSIDQGTLHRLRNSLESIMEDTLRTVDLFADHVKPEPALGAPTFLAVRGDGGFPFFGSTLRTSSGYSIDHMDYRSYLQEGSSNHSNSKFSKCGGTPVTVGALARLNLGFPMTTAAETVLSREKGKLKGGIWLNSLAQAIELVYAVEQAIETVAQILSMERPGPLVDTPARRGNGIAATEAPRGVLIHSYSFDNRGYCNGADVITPTAINQLAMEESLCSVAHSLEGASEADMKLQLEKVVRAYDPCISCAVHVIDV